MATFEEQMAAYTRWYKRVSARPVDTEAQAKTRAYMWRLLTDHPNGTDQTKNDHKAKCIKQFGVSDREVERIWRNEIPKDHPLRTPGPRGPHKPRKKRNK
jgi:hypothetical protein